MHPRALAILSSDPEGPVVRRRWLAYRPALARSGIEPVVVPWPKARRGRREALARIRSAGVVVISSRLLHPADLKRVRQASRVLVFDYDDALAIRDSARGARPSFTRSRRFRSALAAADLAVAGSRRLQAWGRRLGHRPLLLPTTVDSPAAPPPFPQEEVTVLGWMGSESTLPYLERLGGVLSALADSGVAFRLLVIAGPRPPRLPARVPVEHRLWGLSTWRKDLATCHLGLAPLPDDPWTRGKCGLRILELMAIGRPVVASAVGVQRRQVAHGRTGYLARDEGEFLDGLTRLSASRARCEAWGAAAFDEVRERWSVAAWEDRVAGALAPLFFGRGRSP